MLALVQGAYFAVTGLWPLLAVDSFQKVTGPKTDLWLVKTVGMCVLATALALIVAGAHNDVTPAIATLGAATAAGFLLIDTRYVATGRISPVYLLDAAIEVAFLLAWLFIRPG